MPSVSRQRDYIRSRITDYYPGEWEYDYRRSVWAQALAEYGDLKRYSACLARSNVLSHIIHLRRLDLQENLGMLCLWNRGSRTILPTTLVTAPTLERCAEKLRPIGQAFMAGIDEIEAIRKDNGLIEMDY